MRTSFLDAMNTTRLTFVLFSTLAFSTHAGAAPAPTTLSKLWGRDGELWSAAGRLPDFSYAGYRNGEREIPDYPVTANVVDFGAKGDDDQDDTAAFQAALAATESGAILIPPGRYIITDILKITRSGVVLRGAGATRTTLFLPKPLEAIKPNTSATTSGRPTSSYSWSGGIVQLEGDFNSGSLTPIATEARRGDHVITVANSRALSAGQVVEVRQSDTSDNTLARHLYSEDSGDISNLRGKTAASLVTRISRIDGPRVTLERPLRFDIRPEWSPIVRRFEPTVMDSGVEDLTFEFPAGPYEGHFTELGFNPLSFANVAHCWARRLRFLNPDSGPMVGGVFNTISDVVFESLRAPDKHGNQGHHGIILNRIGDHLFTRFDFRMRFIHDVGMGNQSAGVVMSQGKGVDLCFDNHKRAPYDNLFTMIDVGKGTRPWASGGGLALGKHSGARATFWNLRSERPLPYPKEDYAPWSLNLVGVNFGRTDTTEPSKAWVEGGAGAWVYPEDLHAAQLARRLRTVANAR
ncbi:MAG: glycosyl hydrolase family 28-related protein [Verrucomicrobiota bacterium]